MFKHLFAILLLVQLFTWQDNSDNEDGFKFYRNRAGVWSIIGTTLPNVLTFTDPMAAPGDCYQVDAFNTVGESAFSNSVCLPLLPQAPTNLQKK